MSRVTIVVPCYNEAERLELDRFAAFAERSEGLTFLFVDDGSSDGTGELLSRFCEGRPDRFQLLTLPANAGKAEAVRRGVLAALEQSPGYVGYWDADLATPLETISIFRSILDESPGIELVLGSRVQLLGRTIERTHRRHYLGRIFATAASLTLGLRVYDTQCGAKLFRVSPLMRDLFETPFLSRWIFDVELLARLMASRNGGGLPAVDRCVYEFPLLEWRDVGGSKIRPGDFITAARDLGRIYRRYRRPDIGRERMD